MSEGLTQLHLREEWEKLQKEAAAYCTRDKHTHTKWATWIALVHIYKNIYTMYISCSTEQACHNTGHGRCSPDATGRNAVQLPRPGQLVTALLVKATVWLAALQNVRARTQGVVLGGAFKQLPTGDATRRSAPLLRHRHQCHGGVLSGLGPPGSDEAPAHS